ncbi:MAG: hypothetical protein J6U18_00030, partial [Acetobacter sp.]|nr:hypothetical protein [Acetobacter sp.]
SRGKNRTTITGHTSAVTGHTSAVTGHTSAVTGHTSAVTGHTSAVTGSPPTVPTSAPRNRILWNTTRNPQYSRIYPSSWLATSAWSFRNY